MVGEAVHLMRILILSIVANPFVDSLWLIPSGLLLVYPVLFGPLVDLFDSPSPLGYLWGFLLEGSF